MKARWTSHVAPHSQEKLKEDLSNHEIVRNHQPGWFYEVWTVAGGGGGHKIHISDFNLQFTVNQQNSGNNLEFIVVTGTFDIKENLITKMNGTGWNSTIKLSEVLKSGRHEYNI